VAVGVEPLVDMLADDSVLPGARLYRPGDAFTGESPRESDRSGIAEDNDIPAKWSIGFLMSPSSLEALGGPASERLEEPDVETVESDEEDGWVGWPRRPCFTWVGSCCVAWFWGIGADSPLCLRQHPPAKAGQQVCVGAEVPR
jgi:hypothetical protein